MMSDFLISMEYFFFLVGAIASFIGAFRVILGVFSPMKLISKHEKKLAEQEETNIIVLESLSAILQKLGLTEEQNKLKIYLINKKVKTDE